MMRKVPGALAALALTLPSLVATPATAAEPAEVVFIGREIDLAKSFVCGGKTRKAGHYGLEVSWDASAARSKLTVFKGEETLCEVRGESLAGSDLPAGSRTRCSTFHSHTRTEAAGAVSAPRHLCDNRPNGKGGPAARRGVEPCRSRC
jgi:hypothetical protein